jgi:hypothetical protein
MYVAIRRYSFVQGATMTVTLADLKAVITIEGVDLAIRGLTPR